MIGEPDPHLFEVASGLTEMKPSEALRKLWSSIDLGSSDDFKAQRARGRTCGCPVFSRRDPANGDAFTGTDMLRPGLGQAQSYR